MKMWIAKAVVTLTVLGVLAALGAAVISVAGWLGLGVLTGAALWVVLLGWAANVLDPGYPPA